MSPVRWFWTFLFAANVIMTGFFLQQEMYGWATYQTAVAVYCWWGWERNK